MGRSIAKASDSTCLESVEGNQRIRISRQIVIDFCSTFRCTPLNGTHQGDTEGQFTFVSDQGNSVLDYCIVSSDMYFGVSTRVESDHLPIQLSIMTTELQTQTDTSKKETVTSIK